MDSFLSHNGGEVGVESRRLETLDHVGAWGAWGCRLITVGDAIVGSGGEKDGLREER